MSDSKRVFLLFLLLCVLAVSVASTVMIFWYASTKNSMQQRLAEMTASQRSIFRSVYDDESAVDPKTAEEKAIRFTMKNVSFICFNQFRSSFAFATKRNGIYTVYTNGRCGERMIRLPYQKMPKDSPIIAALSGRTGTMIGHSIHGKKIMASYGNLRLGGNIYAFSTAVDKRELNNPKINAALCATAIALVIILGGGISFYRLSAGTLRKIRSANDELSVFAHILDNVEEFIAFIDNDLKYVVANQNFLTLFRVNAEEVKGKDFGSFFKTAETTDIIPRLKKCLAGEKTRYQFWMDVPGKGMTFVDLMLLPHHIGQNITGVVLTATDRTSEENNRQNLINTAGELKKLTTELEERVNSETEKRIKGERIFFEQKKFADMGQMINAIAHQWRQPINSIGLYVQLIYESIKDKTIDDNMLEEFKRDTLNLVQHMSKTIDDFRSFFNPRPGEKSFEVVKAILDTISLVEAQLKNNNISFTVSCKCAEEDFTTLDSLNHPPCKYHETLVEGISTEFRQVIMNLVQNARDALLAGQRSGTSKFIKIAVSADEQKVTVNIADNGGGIPDDVIERIFEPYFTTKPEDQGTGIGLYMSKVIITDHMHGALSVKNADEGAVFTISLNKIKSKG